MPKEQPLLHDKVQEMLLHKIKQRHQELNQYRFWSPRRITDIRMRETTAYEKIDDALSTDCWREIAVGDEWGGNGEFAWFRLKFTVPEEFAGKKLVAILRLGLVGWLGGEGCLFINGVPYQGIDRNHPEVVLANEAVAGQEYDLVVECVSTEVWRYKTGKVKVETAEIAAVNPDVWDYWFNLGYLIGIAESLQKDERRRATIVRTANKSVDAFDFEQTGFVELAESARAANEILAPLYGKPADASALEFACAGHSHIDVAWLWPYAETIRKCSRTFSTVDRLMEEYPHYLFTQRQAQLYEFTKEHYPALYEKVKKRVAERRFEPQGSMWVEADCNICSGESLVRQILLGKNYFLDEFGIETNCFWLPDVFGYSAALPGIIKRAGIPYFMTIKISWSQFNRFPYSSFWWEGIDGTKVLAHFPPADNYNATIDAGDLRRSAFNYREQDRSDIALHSYGWGDGGGGPDRTHLEYLKRAADLEGVPKCTPMWTADFFRLLEERSEDLPSWVGELYLEYHRGTYTTQARNKRFNRKSESLLRDVEMAAGLAWILAGAAYPMDEITRAWKLVCKNQFHDVIPGSSVTEVYKDSTADYEEVFAQGKSMLDSAIGAVCPVSETGTSAVLMNSLSWDRADAARIKVPGTASEWSVQDADGEILPSQPSVDDPSEMWVSAGSVPSIGMKPVKLVKGAAGIESPISVTEAGLENTFYRISLDSAGQIASIYDKRAGREVLPEGEAGNVFQLFEDKPLSSDAWDIDFYYTDKCREITELTEVLVEESGPVRGTLRIRREFGSSVIDQRIVVWADSPRIDFETKVNWQEHKKMLKVAFPVDVHANSARFEIQFGSVDRPNHSNTSWDFARFEVAAQKWADLSQPGYGVSLLNDCKYGHDVHGNVLRLTLLRATTDPDPYADRCEHEFTYSLLPHQGDWRDGETVRHAYELNVPMLSALASEAPSAAKSFLGVDVPNVVIEAVKKAEKEEALIVRMYETSGADADVRLRIGFPVAIASECDLMERDISVLDMDGDSIALSMGPFDIRTVKLVIGNQ